MIVTKSPLQRIGWGACIAVDPRLSKPTKIIAHSFMLHCSNDNGECFTSIGTICKETLLARPSVLKGKKELETHGYLIVKREKDGDINKVNTYLLVVKDITHLGNIITHPRKDYLLGVVNNIAPNKVSKEQGHKTRSFRPPTLKEFQAFCNENNFGHIAQKAFKGYSENGWYDTQGNEIKNWKQKLRNVWFKDSNKQSDNFSKTKYERQKDDTKSGSEF